MPDSLGTLNGTRAISKQAFKSVQRDMLERIANLSELIYEQKRAAIIVFEGWDAAGKGTTIRASDRAAGCARVQGAVDAGAAHTRDAKTMVVALLDEPAPLWTNCHL